MNVMNSPVDLRAHDDHLRHLLDQRAARADLHGRFPSLSEFSDSPSVYSHPHFSPRPSDRPFLVEGHPPSFRIPQSPKVFSPSFSEPRSPISDRERLNIPHASSLDLEDDPRSSADLNSLCDGEDDTAQEDEEEEVPRISTYGPKMRFHTPAPWEEDDTDARSIAEEPTKRFRKKDTAKKWGLSRGNGDPRPSTDSSGSSKPKQSFDSANGALAVFAQASMSSTSLVINHSPQSHSLRDKLSLPRLRARTPSSIGPSDAYTPSNVSPVSRIATPPQTDVYGDDRSLLGHSSTRSGTPQHEYTHPYANPDLVRVAEHNLLPPPSPHHFAFGTNRGESNATLTDTTPSSSISQFRSTTTLSMSPGTSMTSVNPSLNESPSSSRGGPKGISSPMPIDKASLHPDALNKLNGFQQSPIAQATGLSPVARNRDTMTMGGLSAWENGKGSALKLISLEEAQAQLKERSRSATAHPAFTNPFAGSSKPVALEDGDSQRTQMRARSSSAGAKGRSSDTNSRYGPSTPGDSPISGPRQIVKKKSGFMRLFNGKERISPSSPPPPVPMFAHDALASNPPPTPSQYIRPRQGSSHRVPVPSLSPSLMGENAGCNGGSSESLTDSPATSSTGSSASSKITPQQQLNARRKVPELSIVTSPSLANLSVKVPHTAPMSAGPSSEMMHYRLAAAPGTPEVRSMTPLPNSAPPTNVDFVGLSLRPLSTLFTRELKELAVTDNGSLRARPSLEVDTGTPTTATTATTAVSPLSADFPATQSLGYERSSHDKVSPLAVMPDDQSVVIQALQEQILAARRAWQRQIWELEGQVRDLKAEVEELRAADCASEFCATCGRGSFGRPGSDDVGAGGGRTIEELRKAGVKVGGVVNRPRARTGVGSRFASGT